MTTIYLNYLSQREIIYFMYCSIQYSATVVNAANVTIAKGYCTRYARLIFVALSCAEYLLKITMTICVFVYR